MACNVVATGATKRQIILAVLFFALPAPAWAIPNLSGEWRASFTLERGMKDEDVMIRQSGDRFQATKITGDIYVPAGLVNLRGRIGSGRFAAEQLCDMVAFNSRVWEKVTITILDKDHFRVEGGCSGDVVWTRDRTPKLS